jgi:putative ABC transport system permease protein
MFTSGAAQRFVAAPAKFDSIGVVAAPGVGQSELLGRIRPVLPSGVEAVTGEAATAESQSEFKAGLSFFNTFMIIFAIVALVVGGFMIFNTFSITVAQRTRENGLLRALGAGRRQLLSSVLIEALAVGILASVLGMAAGVLVAGGLKAMLAALGFDIPAGGVVFTLRTVIVSVPSDWSSPWPPPSSPPARRPAYRPSRPCGRKWRAAPDTGPRSASSWA